MAVSIGFGQNYTISTVAGAGWDIPGLSANLSYLEGLAVDGAGNVFMTLNTYSVVVRLDTKGQLSLVAGNGIAGFSGDGGAAALAELSGPTGVVVDTGGNVYIEDSGNGRIRMVSNGVITTVAGGGMNDDGPATSAHLNFQFVPPELAVDLAGNIYFADFSMNLYRIRKLSNGVISTVAGGGILVGDNYPATSTYIAPQGIAVDSSGNIYFSDDCSQRIRKIVNGTITTVAGNGELNPIECAAFVSGPDTGKATSVGLDSPRAVAVDAAGNIYFTEGRTGPFRVRKVSGGNISTVAGGNTGLPGPPVTADNIPATSATLELFILSTIAVDTAGNLYIPDEYWETVPPGGYYSGDIEASNNFGRLRKVSNGVITTIAGSGSDGGSAATAQLNLPAGVAVAGAGNLYIGDSGNGVLRAVSHGIIGTIAGARIPGGCECNTGPQAGVSVGDITGIAVDSASNVYMADGAVLRLSQGGAVSPVGLAGVSVNYSGVALDGSGNLYFANRFGNQIEELSNGVLTTIAGTGVQGFGGDNGPATGAELSLPSGIAVDRVGNVYFSDTGNQRVRKISAGVITTVAGNGTAGFSGDNGPATSAQLNLQQSWLLPAGVAVDSSGNVFIVDSGNQRVREVANGVISTIAGTGSAGYSGDGGPATSGELNNPSGIATDTGGKIYISDSNNGRIRVLTSNCTYSVSPVSILVNPPGGQFSIRIQTDAGCSWSVAGVPSWILPAPPFGTGPATVSLVIPVNNGAARMGNLSIAGQPVSVTQAAAPPPCMFTVTPSLVQIPPSGGTFTLTVQTGLGCAWSFGVVPTWIQIPPFLPPTVGSGSVLLTVVPSQSPANIAHLTVAGQPVTVVQGPAPGLGPVITSVMTAGGESPVIAPNTWVEIKGASLGLPEVLTWQSSDFVNGQLPTTLDGVSVTMNGERSYVYYAGLNQIDVLTPSDLALGPVQVVVTVATVSSAPFTSQAQALSPALFVINGGPYVAAAHSDGSLISSGAPAKAGETILLFANGFGPTNVPVVGESVSQSGTLSPLPTVVIGGVQAVVSYAGLAAVGEFQFNVVVPSGLGNGDQPIVATYGGQSTQVGTLITIHN